MLTTSGCTISGLVSLILTEAIVNRTKLTILVCAYQIMIMCSWSCNIILYGTVFDLGGKDLFLGDFD
jgi:hypothetical protein